MAKWPYSTAQWQKVRKLKLQASPLCEYCLPHRRTLATQVDHLKAIEDGGEPFDMANLRSTCAPCHSAKTVHMDRGFGRKRGERMPVKGCDAQGWPLDPEHEWHGKTGDRPR